jgi:protease I
MATGVTGRAIAFLAAEGVDQHELAEPWDALSGAGADVRLVSLEGGEIGSTAPDDVAARFAVDRVLSNVRAGQYDALVLPGGKASVERLRSDPAVAAFVKAFVDADKPVAAIDDAVGLLVEAGVVRGRTLTSSHSLAADVRNAGGEWVDKPVVVDQKLITSREPGDLTRFCARILDLFGDAIDERRLDSTVEQSFPASDPPPGPTTA